MDFVWNFLVINPQLQDQQYLKQQICNLIENKDLSTADGLLQNIPYSFVKTVKNFKSQINVQVATAKSEEFYTVYNFQQYKPNAIILFVPKTVERQKLLVQNLQKIKTRVLKTISKQLVFRAIIGSEQHVVIDQLQQLLEESEIQVDIIKTNYMSQLIDLEIDHAVNMGKDIVSHVGEDYSNVYSWIKTEKKAGCSAM